MVLVSIHGPIMKGLIVFIVTLCFVPSKVLSIHCFDCNSFYDARCSDPFDNSTTLSVVNCDAKPNSIDLKSTFCRKTTQRGNFIKLGNYFERTP